MSEKLLTINEIAEKLRVSRHTVQAWISPSSPNHKPEFANMARHSGRKTVFIESEIDTWLNQRKGAIYSLNISETSAYWRERFVSARGLFKNIIKPPAIQNLLSKKFAGGKLAIDYEPLLIWLTDSHNSSDIYTIINGADNLIISIPLVWWLLRKFWRNKKHYNLINKFLLEDNIFELAPMNETSLKLSFELPLLVSDISLQSYACCISAGASSLLTCNETLLGTKGLSVCSF